MRLTRKILAGACMTLALVACDTDPEEETVGYETESTMTESDEAYADEAYADSTMAADGEIDAYADSTANARQPDMYDQPMPAGERPMSGEDGAAADTALEASTEQPLTDSEGQPLYVLEVDRKGEINCTDECAELWVPAVASETEIDTSQVGVQDALIDSIERPDGVVQLTYNGHPLYYYPEDIDLDLAALEESSGKWFLINADGDAIDEEELQTS